MKNTAIILLLAAAAGCTTKASTVDTKAEGEKLMQISRDWSRSVASHDVGKILSYWADDAVMISAGDPTLKGKPAIRKMVEGSLKDTSFKISWEPQSAEIASGGDMGYLLEGTKIVANDSTGKPVTHTYKGITIWKKQADGTWKNVVDILSPESSQK